jgi:hypothetical protein
MSRREEIERVAKKQEALVKLRAAMERYGVPMTAISPEVRLELEKGDS